MRSKLIFIILLLSILSLTGCRERQVMIPIKNLAHKTAVLIIAFNGFQDREYEVTRGVLEEAGVKVIVASSALGRATGKSGSLVEVDSTLDEVAVESLDALVFIGGPGAKEYFNNKTAHFLVREAVERNKILAAICIAPEILAKAGVLTGKQATVWSSFVDRSTVEALKRGGAIYLDQEVVVDGLIVTANGPAAAEKFGLAIVDLLR